MTPAALWASAEAVEATGGQVSGDWTASGISIDSRSVAPGDLFVALEGPNFDGHDFIAKALAGGAVAAMAHRRPDGLDPAAPLLLVDDTLAALNRLGAAARVRSQARFAGVTGSVGKTGTKEAIRHCLAAQAPTSASAASLNNHWGVPLSLARMDRQARYGVFEMGMNHAGEIRALTRLVRPHVALITTVEAAHSAHFDSIEGIAEAKAEIFEGVEPGGTAILKREHPLFQLLAARAREAGIERIVTFGRHPDADAHVLEATLDGGHSRIRASVHGAELAYRVGLPGDHWVENSLAVLATVAALGADLAAAAGELAGLQPLKGRGAQRSLALPGGGFTLIDDSYNANPTSMRAAFQVLRLAAPGAGGRRLAVLGDMLELGSASRNMHADLSEPLLEAGIDLVFTCGADMAALDEALPAERRGGHAADSAKLAPLVAAALRPGDVVLVKGSLGSRMANVIEALSQLGEAPARAANGQ
ncbi:MAG: UDP-N-acetylmuramoylalanyl-D-glutamyl-2,6-diaminopimelate--D-alanyl-D-alanine ligase [Kiloniellales bacterium]|nr:UDP-N-acetylmuramoylalanyl-D-glutamyl-2,6-diaminopimelate--D-alanyl-D-alanine ligase [Kiloniellales bacterium]